MATGLAEQKLLFPGNLHVCDLNSARNDVFVAKFGAVVHSDLKSCVADADVVLLSVKPQNFGTIAAELNGSVGDETVILSIIAGLSLAQVGRGSSTQNQHLNGRRRSSPAQTSLTSMSA